MTDPNEERRQMKRNKEHYGIPTQCPCGGCIVDEVAGTDKVCFDTQPGRRFFVCHKYEPDGLHVRQPWVKGVVEEFFRLTTRLEACEKQVKEVFALSYKNQTLTSEQIGRLTKRVEEAEQVLSDVLDLTHSNQKLKEEVDNLSSRVAELEYMT